MLFGKMESSNLKDFNKSLGFIFLSSAIFIVSTASMQRNNAKHVSDLWRKDIIPFDSFLLSHSPGGSRLCILSERLTQVILMRLHSMSSLIFKGVNDCYSNSICKRRGHARDQPELERTGRTIEGKKPT